MTTTIIDTATATAGGQIRAAGTLLAILTAHAALPTPDVRLQLLDAPEPHYMAWGVNISLHDGLDQFEQWRAALGLDPAAVDSKQAVHGTTAWLTVSGTHSGVPIALYGFFELPEPADSDGK
ncbi:hypothetical protein ACWEQL_19435 [Kitasatospora sp. NPDC004240]